jgi:isopenicillin-N epimerase
VIEAVLAAATPRTRLLLIDHVTSQTGLVLPVADIVAEVEGRGIEVLVDGAHAPGMVDLDVTSIGAAFYTGNCHKWLCAPKGAAFLAVRADWRPTVRPLVISHGAGAAEGPRDRFRLEFDWTGTDDPTPYLTVPSAISTLAGLMPGGWPAIRAHNRALALRGREIVCSRLGVAPPCPESMIGSLAAVPLPDGQPIPSGFPPDRDPLQDTLLNEHHIEVPVIPWPRAPRRLVRLSAQLYNREEHYVALADALEHLLAQV